ncbi:hypothetical protein I551_2839 [Mycobacterium ulcerans str. Harvey]|uniref:Uncharacterized protein n=1 Tax=Mycobacterium ulcerans str. Harvey TaxID=1299332 RepID=A0ABP3AI52_MYCUL|nr:hypothetical protein I551_2839 [Mycobacterium ulcerans str. Harvey]
MAQCVVAGARRSLIGVSRAIAPPDRIREICCDTIVGARQAQGNRFRSLPGGNCIRDQ